MGTDSMKRTRTLADLQVVLIIFILYLVFSGIVPVLPALLDPRIHSQGVIFFTVWFIVTGLLIANTIAYSRLIAKET